LYIGKRIPLVGKPQKIGLSPPPAVSNVYNILQAAFTCADPKSAKRQSSNQCIFALLGPASVKAAV